METKEFYKTSEFWLTMLMNVTTAGAAVAGTLPAKYGVPTLTVINGLYAVARGLAKAGVPPVS